MNAGDNDHGANSPLPRSGGGREGVSPFWTERAITREAPSPPSPATREREFTRPRWHLRLSLYTDRRILRWRVATSTNGKRTLKSIISVCLALALMLMGAEARAGNDAIRIGVLTDMSGPYSDN